MQQKDRNVQEQAGLLELGVKMGILTAAQTQSVSALQSQMRRAGITLPVGQTLLERKYITLDQLKSLRTEFAKLAAAARRHRPLPHAKTRGDSRNKFGQYEILQVLSEKDRARVYKARDSLMDRIVVLKVLPRSMTSDVQWAERFKRETMLAGKLVHPNIATVYGAGEVDGNPLMAIEFIEGMSLGERLEREGNLPEKVAWRTAKEVSKALGFAAQQGVIHRDVKPDNILCSVDGKIKIIDLGLSKSQGDTSGLTLDGTTVGTPFYISPEQARGTHSLDSRSDLYSLGCTVFHMLTGSVPFFHEEFTEVMFRQTQAPRPDPRDILPEISEGSAPARGAHDGDPKPEDRPASFEELIEEIDQLLPLLPEPMAEVRPVQHVASTDAQLTNRRDEFWVPPPPPGKPAPAPAPAAKAAPIPEETDTRRASTHMYPSTPKPSVFADQPAATQAPTTFFGRIGAWFGKLFG